MVERTVSTEDGRALCLMEAGRADGVLVHGGTPNSRMLYDGWIADAVSRGIRLISYDRPGCGGSTAQPGRKVASAAVDVATIAKALGLERLLVWGISGGGPHALACAALLPGLVVAVAALAPPAPYPAEGLDWFAGMGEMNVIEFTAALTGREACEKEVEASAAELLAATPDTLEQALHSLVCPADAFVLTKDFATFALCKIRAGISATRTGWVDDELAFMTPWGFSPSEIGIPLLLMHGAQDQMVPLAHGQWLASKIPNVETRFLPDDGHLTLSVRRVPEVHAWLLSQWQNA